MCQTGNVLWQTQGSYFIMENVPLLLNSSSHISNICAILHLALLCVSVISEKLTINTCLVQGELASKILNLETVYNQGLTSTSSTCVSSCCIEKSQ